MATKLTKAQAGALGGKRTVAVHGAEYMAEIGRRGAATFWARYTLRPIGTDDFAIVRRDTGEPTGRTVNGQHIPPRKD